MIEEKPMKYKVFPSIEAARVWVWKGTIGTNKTAYFEHGNIAWKIVARGGLVKLTAPARGDVLPDGRTVEEALKLLPYRGKL